MICKKYIQNKCDRNPCKFKHIDNICFHFFMKGQCKYGNSCKLSHDFSYQQKPKNTESFIPSHKPSDMRLMFSEGGNHYPYEYQSRDVIIVKNLFTETYDQLITELKNCGTNETELFKLWHGDSHLIADDHIKEWKSKCPIFTSIIEKLKSYFNMDVKATRFNWYRNGLDWKPFHHDAAAIDPKKAKSQNMTIGISFGRSRSACFEHATTRTTIELPLENGTIYCFGSKLNMEWRHGITQLSEEERIKDDGGRISIILWGWVNEL